MTMTKTFDELILCAQREVALRKSVYKRRVDAKKMTAFQADYEIKCMEEIAEIIRRMKAIVTVLK